MVNCFSYYLHTTRKSQGHRQIQDYCRVGDGSREWSQDEKVPKTDFTLSYVCLELACQDTPSPHYFLLHHNKSLLPCPVSLSQVQCNQCGEDLESSASPQAPEGHQQGQGSKGKKDGPKWGSISRASINPAVD